MKLIAATIDRTHEQMRRENRQRGVYPPPDDGQEWMLLDDAAKLFGVVPKTLANRARREDWTRTSRHGCKIWLLKKEVQFRLDFLKRRERWYKSHRPAHWKPEVAMNAREEEEGFRRTFFTTAQAAAFMGVSKNTIHKWTKQGRIPVFLTRKQGKGGRNWYSPTSLRNLKEDEERTKRLQAQEKAKATMRQGVVARQVYNQSHRARVYKNLPPGWLTVRQAAERLDVSHGTMRDLARRGCIRAEHLTGKWDTKQRPYFFHEVSVEEYKNTEYSQRKHRQGKRGALAVIGGDPTDAAALHTAPTTETELPSFGYSRAELTLSTEQCAAPDWNRFEPILPR